MTWRGGSRTRDRSTAPGTRRRRWRPTLRLAVISPGGTATGVAPRRRNTSPPGPCTRMRRPLRSSRSRDLLAEPAAHLTPVLPARKPRDPDGAIELVPQRLAAAELDPGEMLDRAQAERHGGEDRRRPAACLANRRRPCGPSRQRLAPPRRTPRRPARSRRPRKARPRAGRRSWRRCARSDATRRDAGAGQVLGQEVTMRQLHGRLRAGDGGSREGCGRDGRGRSGQVRFMMATSGENGERVRDRGRPRGRRRPRWPPVR